MKLQTIPGPELPLRGVRVLVTRPRRDAEQLRSYLESLGALVYHLPTISIRATVEGPDIVDALGRIATFDWLVFTSRNAVRVVFDWLEARQTLPLASVKLAAIGPGTASELSKRGADPQCIPAKTTGAALTLAMRGSGVSGMSVLLPLGDLASDAVEQALQNAGANVTVIRVYATVPPERVDQDVVESIARGEIDVVTLASPSAFRNLLELDPEHIGEALRHTKLVTIGPTTAKAVRQTGYTPSAIAQHQTALGLVEAINDLYMRESR